MAETVGVESSSERKPWLLESVAVLLLLIDMALSSMAEAAAATSLSKLMAALFAPAILLLLIAAVARAFKLVRSRRGVAQLSVGVLSFMLLGECGRLGKGTPLATTASEAAKELVAEGTSMVPRQVSSDTELFAVAAEGATAIYSYRLLHASAQSVEKAVMDGSRPDMVKRICSTALTRRVLQQGVVLRHVFYGSDRVLITSLEVKETDCAAGPPGR